MDTATPRTDAVMNKQPNDGFGLEKKQCIAQWYDHSAQLERELIASAERCKVMESALNQASFCLRELLPNDSDAQMTVRLISQALGSGK